MCYKTKYEIVGFCGDVLKDFDFYQGSVQKLLVRRLYFTDDVVL